MELSNFSVNSVFLKKFVLQILLAKRQFLVIHWPEMALPSVFRDL
jgi:hypothetical protein